ncbi:MAG: carbohydrate ABC transporter permease [Meiothermus sp.]|nr:carbohydrate ABC transporter permease [Meiothermus sp.]
MVSLPRWLARPLFYLGLAVYAFLLVLPLLNLFAASFKSDGELFAPGFWPTNPTLEPYQEALQKYPLARYLLNSLVVALGTTLGVLLLSATLGYALARIPFTGQGLLFGFVVAMLLIPGEVTFLPLYLLVQQLGWLNSYTALIVPFMASPLGIFLLRQFIKSLPQDLFDAARIDGAGHLRMLWHVALPLAAPALGALAALTFLGSWNMYLWPLVTINRSEMMTAQIAVAQVQNVEVTSWNVVAATAILVLFPTLVAFLLAQRFFVRGIALGGLKG